MVTDCDHFGDAWRSGMAKTKALVKIGKIQQRILLIRGEKVILDSTLQKLTVLPPKLSIKPFAEMPTAFLRTSCSALLKGRSRRW